MLRTLAILALSLAATLRLAAADKLEALSFGIISTESSSNLRSVWEPFLKEMEQGIGMPVKAHFASDYAGVIEAMRFDKVQMAWYGNKSAIEAVDRANAEIFVQTVDKDGNPGYWSLIVVHKDSPLASVEELLAQGGNLAFGNGDPNSTSGFLVPSVYVFAKHGIDPKSHFKRMTTSNHEGNALAVANKQVDAATFNTESMNRLKITNPEKAALLKVIWQSPLIPSDPIAWRKDLDPALKTRIKNWFLGYGRTPEQQKVLAGLGWKPFRESGDHQLWPVRQLEIAKNKAKIEKDAQMSAEDKKARLAELDAAFADLQKRIDAMPKPVH